MKRFYLLILVALAVFSFFGYISKSSEKTGKSGVANSPVNRAAISPSVPSTEYNFPEFYRGIYLNVATARNLPKLKQFIAEAKRSHINAFVMDVHLSSSTECVVPKEHVELCKDNGIHPIARIVVFPDGLRHFPVSKSHLEKKFQVAESSCKNGFHEIQFDYIRFYDSSSTRHVTLEQKYAFIEGIISTAKKRLSGYNVKIAADIFGRIPLNQRDIIGQNMESLDKVADIICPMAYPSHYTWSKKFYGDPYYTVYITSKRANERAKRAEIVTYIQAFKMRLGDIPYDRYVRDQIRAIHDSGVKGFLFWNARQDYAVPFQVTRDFYSKQVSLLKNPYKKVDDDS